MALVELARGIFVVVPEAPPRYPYGNCMYLEGDTRAVIDFGAGGRAFAELDKDRIEMGFISHFHFDHVHCNVLFPHTALYVGEEEKETYRDFASYISFHGYDLWDKLMPGVERIPYGEAVPLPDDVPVKPGFREISISGTIKDLDQVNLGGIVLTAIHLPGHSLGHYGFYLEKEGILFSGDIDLVPSGPWYSSNSGDVGALISSVERIREIAPRIIVPSHRRLITENIDQGLRRYIKVVLNREEKIYQLLKEPRTLHDLARQRLVFANPQNMYDVFWEKMTIRNHLKHLMAQGLITEIEEGLFVRTDVL